MAFTGSPYASIETEVLQMLAKDLPEVCTYHSVDHTRDVLNVSVRIALAEGLSPHETELLKLAALFHDTGFLISPVEHEQTSCGIATEYLQNHGYDQDQVDEICKAIMATKIPQQPVNKLGEILCDADLDYLGRDDFYPIGRLLFQELSAGGIIHGEREWNSLQVKFLKQHCYFTSTSINLREPVKRQHLRQIEALLAGV